MSGSGVGLNGLHRITGLGEGVGCGQHPGAQPPQWRTGQLTIDDPTARRDQSGGVVAERGERRCRLAHEQVGGRTLRAGDEPETLNGVHGPRLGAFGPQ